MTRDELTREKIDLTAKLAARERIGDGYADNIRAIKARLAWIEEELNKLG